MTQNKSFIIMGVHIGHDASVTILKDGQIVGHSLRERHSKFRHHLGIDRLTIEIALKQSGLTVQDIDVVAVTGTQQIPNIINDSDWFSISEKSNNYGLKSIRLNDNPWWQNAKNFIVERWKKNNAPEHAKGYVSQLLQYQKIPFEQQDNWELFGILSPLYGPAAWMKPYHISATFSKVKEFFRLTKPKPFKFLRSPNQAFHFPLLVELSHRKIPGFFVNHHMAHAASSYYSSSLSNAMIFTHDGGTSSDSGFFFLGSGDKLIGLGPHYLECGQFYDFVANKLGLGKLGGAGKLMGLASYGQGLLNDFIPQGTKLDWLKWCQGKGISTNVGLYQALWEALVDESQRKGLDISNLGEPNQILSGAPAEIAHAVQHLLENSIFDSVLQASDALRQEGCIEHADYLCISGGVALNCPSNSKLWRSNRFKSIHIEPHCEDGGLSVGSANYIYHQFYGGRRKLTKPPTTASAMIGAPYSETLEIVLERFKDKIRWNTDKNWQYDAALAIINNHVIAVYHGCYETGPRALGHRSILANPTVKDNWEKVNRIKKRESWRPFAPAVLASEIEAFFEGGPPSSPFMLFTHKIRECQKGKLPAVTHVDGTSRVQTLTSEDEPLYSILSHLKILGFPPVIMNTSFNGPGQPILNDYHDAIEMLLNSEIEFLYIDGISIRKISSRII